MRRRVYLCTLALISFTLCFLFYLNIKNYNRRLDGKFNRKLAPEPLVADDQINRALLLNDDKFYNFIKRFPNLLQCTVDYERLYDDAGTNDGTQLNSAVNVRNLNLYLHDMRVTRCILIYFPNDGQFDDHRIEFELLYRTWIEMQSYEPRKWRTDLLVFYDSTILADDPTSHERVKFFSNLNCKFVNRRRSKEDSPGCVLIPYKDIVERDVQPGKVTVDSNSSHAVYEYYFKMFDIFTGNPGMLHAKLKEMPLYDGLDSILIAFDGFEYYSGYYDYVLRVDINTALTPLFATWLPNNCNDFIVSQNLNDNANLASIAKKLNFKYDGRKGFGLTWYSTPNQMRLMSYLTLMCKHYLYMNELSFKNITSVMYSQNLAINHLTATKQFNIIRNDKQLDHSTTNDDSVFNIIQMTVLRQNDALFSLSAFRLGKYDQMKISGFDQTKVKYYTLTMALESKNTNISELLDEQIMKKN